VPGNGRKALEQAIVALQGKQSKVGWFDSARYPDGKPVAGVAYVHEHGSTARGIPPRPFFRPTIENKKQDWRELSANIAKGVVQGKINPDDMLEIVALTAGGDVAKTITKITSPPLKKATVKKRIRGRKVGNKKTAEKPLVDTGLMLASLSAEYNGKIVRINESKQ